MNLKLSQILSESAIIELKEEIRHRDVKSKVKTDITSRPHLSKMSERLENILLKDEDLYNEVINLASENTRSILSERQTVGFIPTKSKTNNIYDEAFKLSSAEGISYKDALAKLGA